MSPEAAKWLDRFFGYLQHERRLSPHTLSNYERDLTRLQEYCDSMGIADWPDLDSHAVRSFVAWRHRKGVGGAVCSENFLPCVVFIISCCVSVW